MARPLMPSSAGKWLEIPSRCRERFGNSDKGAVGLMHTLRSDKDDVLADCRPTKGGDL
jgi:hypothetical protein